MKKINFIVLFVVCSIGGAKSSLGSEVVRSPVLRIRPPAVVPVDEDYWEYNPFDRNKNMNRRERELDGSQDILTMATERIRELLWVGVVYPGQVDPGFVVLRERLWRVGERLDMGDYGIQLTLVGENRIGVRMDADQWSDPFEIEYPIPQLLIGKYKTLGGEE